MKKILIVFLIISLFLTGCSTRIHNINRYGSFTDDKYYLECNLEMFPKNIKENWTVLVYQFWYEVVIYENAYIYLDICFNDEDEYDLELHRILEIKGSYYYSDDTFVEDTRNFNYQAFVLSMGDISRGDSNWQYILTVPNENRIIYVFLQYASLEVIKFPKEHLPLDYKLGTEIDSFMDTLN